MTVGSILKFYVNVSGSRAFSMLEGARSGSVAAIAWSDVGRLLNENLGCQAAPSAAPCSVKAIATPIQSTDCVNAARAY